MATYAKGTEVSAERSRAEIEKTLQRYGATDFGYLSRESGRLATLAFRLASRSIRFEIQLPDPASREFTHSPGRGLPRTAAAAAAAWEQSTRQRWRALALVIKAKLEAVESCIATFDEEFLAWTVQPDGRTVWEQIGPAFLKNLEGGGAPLLLTAGSRA